ncbi:MAG TPA: triose-phosphate isomerase, partial [Acidimicrobiia bacterium]|nr:triose-phosphate isomerase [Acidimicrobiia bacterium]
MHHDHLVAIHTVQKLAFLLEKDDYEAVDVVICPPFTDIRPLQNLMDADKIPMILGAQNCHWEDQGAYTGEVSPPMLAKLNVRYVIVGHSERRQLFGETDPMVNKKLLALQEDGLTPIACLGETLAERDAGITFEVLHRQLAGMLEGIDPATLPGVVIAYEPVWAIGTGKTAKSSDAQSAHAFLRDRLRAWHGEVADRVRILYGGSVKPDNAAELMAQPDVDGVLVGGASLDAAGFAR